MAQIPYLLGTGFRRRRGVDPGCAGRNIEDQVCTGTCLLRDVYCDAFGALCGDCVDGVESGLVPGYGRGFGGSASSAGIIIPASIGPAVEFSGSEFDAKVGRECRSDPVGERERIKRNNSERKLAAQ